MHPDVRPHLVPSMKCYRKNGSDLDAGAVAAAFAVPSMKCYRKNGSDGHRLLP